MTSKVSVLAAGLSALLLTVSATVASAHELSASGTPANLNDGHSGYFVWNDGHTVQLRMESTSDGTTYRGTLTTDGKFRDLTREGDRHDSRIWISKDEHTLRFRDVPPADLSGFHVRVEDSSKVELSLKRDGSNAPTDRIWIGHSDEHPDSSNFTLRV